MKIQKMVLQTERIMEQKDFYTNVLGLDLFTETPGG
jgi:catechol-2,3-dioxygenase